MKTQFKISATTQTLATFLITLMSFSGIYCQQTQEEYIRNYAKGYSKEAFYLDDDLGIQLNDLVFWGYIHGSETPHLLEYKIFEYLAQHGFKYLMPEIGKAQAYFLNKYLKSGNEQFLYLVAYYQGMRTPQDASIQFMDKWKKIYTLNQTLPEKDRFTVLGMEGTLATYDPALAITYLAYLAPEASDIPMIDSLSYFRNPEVLNINIVSGKPALELAIANKRATYDYVYPYDSKYQFGRRFITYYLNNQDLVDQAFGSNKHLVQSLLIRENMQREKIIYKNFKNDVLPLLEKGEKVFSVYGYAHVFQGPINMYDYIAGMIKKNHQNVRTATILGIMAKSSALKDRKLCKTEDIQGLQGITFKGAEYCGYTTSKSFDGDGLFEKLSGLSSIQKVADKKDVVILPLTKRNTPFNSGLTFISYDKGGKRWRPDESLSTIDYIQYLIYIQNSKANTPVEEWVP